eukprot:CAMPEP_0114988792 /NCGR_PEP_ID=MMETSP0216-20121206/9813_1 /TAXON_ID=223996 /ORGANISM="Protocruzia adherens, Strain Boccale" /LENGTH=219 /DNA_ID=CAMNT_0002351647 /DNA_START=52 /DNA_END=711 /DNA_ORIENTATION=-
MTSADPGLISNRNQFEPYVNNGGTVVGIAGKDFVVIGADTRMSVGYTILSREYSKVSPLTSKCLITSSGMASDCSTLNKTIKYRLTNYNHEFKKEPTTSAVAQLLSNTLYSRRFFPYYAFNLVCGLDEEGKGVVYGYDAVGSYDEVGCAAQGSAGDLIQPVLDNQFGNGNDKSITETRETVIDVFSSATERDLYTGDGLDVYVLSKDGLQHERVPLRRD